MIDVVHDDTVDLDEMTGSECNNSLSGHHIADPSAARITILSRRSETMEATKTR